MQYSRPTLVSNWHKNREAEPKDYDFSTYPEGKKCHHKSTYKHIGTYKDADWSTTSNSQLSQCFKMKKDYTVQLPTKMMIPSVLLQFDRDALPGCSQGCDHYNSALPRHPPGYNKMDFDTTHKLDYAPPYHIQTEVVTVKTMAAAKPLPDFRKRQSEFTDVAEHKRPGRNTWQDDKGQQGRPRVTPRDIYAPRGGRNHSNVTLQ